MSRSTVLVMLACSSCPIPLPTSLLRSSSSSPSPLLSVLAPLAPFRDYPLPLPAPPPCFTCLVLLLIPLGPWSHPFSTPPTPTPLPPPLGVSSNGEVSKNHDPGITSHYFDLADSKYVG